MKKLWNVSSKNNVYGRQGARLVAFEEFCAFSIAHLRD